MTYECERCMFRFDKLCLLKRHYSRKTMCSSATCSKYYDQLLRELPEKYSQDSITVKQYRCEYCEKIYKVEGNLRSHLKVCSKNPQSQSTPKPTILERISALEEKVNNLQGYVFHTYKHLIPPSTHPNKFGCEDLSLIQKDFIEQNAFNLSEGHLNLISNLYYNDEYPKNQTVFFKCDNHKLVWIYDGERWIEGDLSQIIDEMARKVFILFTNSISSIAAKKPEFDHECIGRAIDHWNHLTTSTDESKRDSYKMHRSIWIRMKNESAKKVTNSVMS